LNTGFSGSEENGAGKARRYRSESQPEQSYSERQLYEAALDRMAREMAVVEKLDERRRPAHHRGSLQECPGPQRCRRGGVGLL
jgi:hypothetical protein